MKGRREAKNGPISELVMIYEVEKRLDMSAAEFSPREKYIVL